MMNNIGVVVNIEKIFPALAKPEFLQFLLRHERSYHKDAVYFLFKKDSEKIGYVEVRGYGSEVTPSPIQYFIASEFVEFNLEKQMLNFVVQDMNKTSLSAVVENNDVDSIKLYESLGFNLSSTSKIYFIAKEDVKPDEFEDKISFLSVSNLSKSLTEELKLRLEETVKVFYDKDNDLAKAELIKRNYIDTLNNNISKNNSFVLVNEGKVVGWIFFKVKDDETLVLQDSAKACSKQEFQSFTKAVLNKVFAVYKNVKMEKFENDSLTKEIVETTTAKPKHIYYQYIKEKEEN